MRFSLHRSKFASAHHFPETTHKLTGILITHSLCVCSHVGNNNSKGNNHPRTNKYGPGQISRGQSLCICKHRHFTNAASLREDGEVRDYLKDVRSVFHFPAVTSDASQKYQDNLFSSAHPVMDPNPQSQHGQFQTSDLHAVSSLWEARMTALSSPAGQTSLTCS